MLDWLADTLLRRSLKLRYAEIREREPLCCLGSAGYLNTKYRLRTIGQADAAPRWQGCLCTVENDGLHLYPRTRQWDIHVRFDRDSLRWFGRPQKYSAGTNEIWLHFERDDQWHLLMLRTSRHAMAQFVRAVKEIATPEQVQAYRRRRPYIHFGPTPAQHAQQNLHGAWTVDPAGRTLYLTPSALVELDGDRVQRTMALDTIQQIEVMARLDAPGANGVVRFKVPSAEGATTLAYTLPDHVAFGAALSEAAKRTLEDVPIFYGKKGDEDDW
ncbi:MAG: hypothetical protein IT320_19690 [Anaerolineae bacterium]|nr:hypothetical protein [Anaerolineae bacterium]